MINLLFSMVGPRFTEQEASAFASVAEWVVVSERSCRLMIDGVGDASSVDAVFAALNELGRDPKIIGAWAFSGDPLVPFNLEAWLEVAPDDPPAEEGGSPTRPTAFRDLHVWAGWGEKVIE